MGRKKQSVAEDVIEIVSKCHWGIGVILAIASFLILHWYAGREVTVVAGMENLSKNTVNSMFHVFAYLGQVALPGLFGIGAAISLFNRIKISSRSQSKVEKQNSTVVDKIHDGRKQDKRSWEREVGNPRNDFVGYSNGEIPVDQSGEGFAATSKGNKVKRVVFTVGIVITCFLLSLVYFRPDLFPFLSHSKFYQTISNFLPDKKKDRHPLKSATLEISKDSSTEPREHSFSEEQILRAKKAVLEAQKNKSHLTGIEIPEESSSGHSFKDSKNRYEIQLLSGRYVYADSVIVTKDMITFENKKGLAVSVNRDEVKSLKKME